jgi:hypothetical protein
LLSFDRLRLQRKAFVERSEEGGGSPRTHRIQRGPLLITFRLGTKAEPDPEKDGAATLFDGDKFSRCFT